MPRRLIDAGREPGMLLDIASYARGGRGGRDQLSPAEIEVIARTVRRTPEAMVKVLNRGGQNLAAVARHIDYLSREGEFEIETDEGERLKGSYDAAGNTTAYGSLGFSYNDRGRMAVTSGGSTDYLYNALGQMIEKSGTAGTTIFMQDEAGHLIGEYDGSGNLIEETVWLGNVPVATLRPNGTGGVNIFYVHTDHLNTPRKVAQPTSGTLAWRWDTDPFGTAAPNQNPGGLGTFVYNLRAPGQYYQAETGLNQNWNRDYDPMVGRYVESDPIGLDQTGNTYDYVNGNPIENYDPLGLFTYNAGPPRTVPVPPALGAKITCTENCFGTPLVVTGGMEKHNPSGGLYHTPNSLHYTGHAADFSFRLNPAIADHVTKFICCAVKCGLSFGGPEDIGTPNAHFHLQDVAGNGYDQPWKGGCPCGQ
jgi:RHS repeat-associated protein